MHHQWIRRIAVAKRGLFASLISLCLACFIGLFFTQTAHATVTQYDTGRDTITLDVRVGLNATVHEDYWIPVAVTLTNAGTAFQGTLTLRTYSALPPRGFSRTVVIADSSTHFDRSLLLPHGKQVRLSLALPFDVGQTNPRGVGAQVYDAHGKLVASQRQDVYTLNPGDISVGILSDEQDGFNILNNVALPSTSNSLLTIPLDATSFPTQSVFLDNLDVLILDNFATSTLHPAQLAALSGAGYSYLPCNGSCATQAILEKRTIITPNTGVPHLFLTTGSDPLLLQNAPATLIGWADASLDSISDVTVNGLAAQGQHQNFVQVPLNLDITNSLNVPPDFLTGQVIDTQGSDVTLVAPNVYSLSRGNITFGLTLPRDLHITRGLTLTLPNSTTGTLNASTYNAQAHLYNWQTRTWNGLSLNQDVLHTNDTAYVGTNGQVLLQVAPITAGTLYVSKPYLTV